MAISVRGRLKDHFEAGENKELANFCQFFHIFNQYLIEFLQLQYTIQMQPYGKSFLLPSWENRFLNKIP